MTKPNKLPPQEYLKECFDYNPETGKLFWRVRPIEHFQGASGWKSCNARCAGKEAFTASRDGYFCGDIFYENYLAHRVIWKLWYGDEPDIILHENGNTSDNRIEKLSNGTNSDNSKDQKLYITNTSGIAGVRWEESRNKWRACLYINGKATSLGRFTDFFEACCARKSAEVRHGYHPNHGKR